jgi:hypothetical protein
MSVVIASSPGGKDGKRDLGEEITSIHSGGDSNEGYGGDRVAVFDHVLTWAGAAVGR